MEYEQEKYVERAKKGLCGHCGEKFPTFGNVCKNCYAIKSLQKLRMKYIRNEEKQAKK